MRNSTNTLCAALLAAVFPGALFSVSALAHDGQGRPQGSPPAAAPRSRSLPSSPAGVTDLKFSEFFVTPVGDRGLALTPRLQSLDGKRVRLLGYMVRQEAPTPGVLLMTPFPLTIHEHEGGFSDLPPATVRVIAPHARGAILPHTPRLLLLTGVLQIGSRDEPDGSVSLVRLTLDPPPAANKAKAAGKKAARSR